ncbi:MAG TPA: hypothetical protein VNL98_02890 [Gemmatimonadales bacterium]|nr:hypothetical protein [Gemmatimonadales bacterium]
MASTAAQALAASESRIVGLFRAGGALNSATAQRLQKLGLSDGKELRGLVKASIIRRAGAGRYFLSETTWATRRHLGARAMVRMLVVVAAVAVGLVFLLAAS